MSSDCRSDLELELHLCCGSTPPDGSSRRQERLIGLGGAEGLAHPRGVGLQGCCSVHAGQVVILLIPG